MKSILDLKIYKIYDVKNGCFINTFNSLKELLYFLSRYQNDNWCHYMPGKEKEIGYCNKYLDDINITFNDTKLSFNKYGSSQDSNGDNIYILRQYAFLDPNNRIIDVREYMNDIIKLSSTKINHKYYSHKWKRYYKSVRYRYDSIPGIHKNHYHRNCFYRHPNVMNEKRQASIVEYKDYIKPASRVSNLPDAWDDKIRHFDKSWKSQSKKRKQWM